MDIRIILLFAVILPIIFILLWRTFWETYGRPKWIPWKIFYPIHQVEWWIFETLWCNRFLTQWRWDRRKDKNTLPIQNWGYNGFSGSLKEGMAPFTGQFVRWTADPGVAEIRCSDGKTRYIPSYAIHGHKPPEPDYEKMKKNGQMAYFGKASSSEN